jgi:ligand-binding SRPBCC domain-containing protein
MIKFYKHSGVSTLHAKQLVNTSIEKAWDFFSKPGNLSTITPPEMDFRLTTPIDEPKMYAGQIITYKVSPTGRFRINWVTEITQVDEGRMFIDEQRFGPYSFWHHRHIFTENESGVEMTDIVTYKIPFGFIGRIANRLFIQKKLRQIFDYRFSSVEKIFNE